MKCPKCGSENEKDSLFCEECGAKLEEKEIKNKPKKNKKKLLIVLFLLVFLVCIGYFGYLYLNKDDYVVVGNYIGYTSDNALSEISNLGLKKKIEYIEVDNSYEYGVVVEQDLKDTKVKVGSTIKLGIGVSKDKVEVPDLTGMSLEEATEELENLGLVISSSEEESDETEEGHIISQSVDEGTNINVGSVIEVVVSRGSKEKEETEESEEKENDSSSSNNSSSSSKSSSGSSSSSSSNSSSSSSSNNSSSSSSSSSSNDNSDSSETTVGTTPSITIGTVPLMMPGKTYDITATVSNYDNALVTWKSSSSTYAFVSSYTNSGTIHYVTIKAKRSSSSVTVTATISGTTVSATKSICIVSYHSGDLNCNGVIDMSDVALVQDYYMYNPTNEAAIYAADMDGDGDLDMVDAALLMDCYKYGGC